MKTRRGAESLSSVPFGRKIACSLKCEKGLSWSGEFGEHYQDNVK